MSELKDNQKLRVDKLINYISGLIAGKKGLDLIEENQILETPFLPEDIMVLFDYLFDAGYKIEDLKNASNKLFNILFKNFSEFEKSGYDRNSIIYQLIQDNAGAKDQLTNTKKIIKQINKNVSPDILKLLIRDFTKIEQFTDHYIVMQNIVFPEIEKQWKQHQCLKILWSFHDDIIQNIKKTIAVLQSKPFDLQLFNKLSSKVYFNLNTIIFREENVLFPIMHDSFDIVTLNKMGSQLVDFKLTFIDNASIKIEETFQKQEMSNQNLLKLSTGELKIDQLELIFNHLPVDITFVDENNEVRYFSSPKHRIFPRTIGIIGREVQHCHPHESVHVVNQIIEAFKNREKDVASFWIKMGPKFVLIQYFAVRDKNDEYKGVLEVSQEISEIQNLKGEHRLLDW